MFQACFDCFFPTLPMTPLNHMRYHSFNEEQLFVVCIGRGDMTQLTLPTRYQGMAAGTVVSSNNILIMNMISAQLDAIKEKRPQIVLSTNLEDIPECLGLFSKPVFKRISLDADFLATLDKESILDLLEKIASESENYNRETPLIIDVDLNEFFKNRSFNDVLVNDVLEIKNMVQDFNLANIQFIVSVDMTKRSAYIAGGKNHLLFTQSEEQKNIQMNPQAEVPMVVEKHIRSFL